MATMVLPRKPGKDALGTNQEHWAAVHADKLGVGVGTLYVVNVDGKPELRFNDGVKDYIVQLTALQSQDDDSPPVTPPEQTDAGQVVYLSNGEVYPVTWLKQNPEYVVDNLSDVKIVQTQDNAAKLTARLDCDQMIITLPNGTTYGAGFDSSGNVASNLLPKSYEPATTPVSNPDTKGLVYKSGDTWYLRAKYKLADGQYIDCNRYGQLGLNLGLTWSEFTALDHDNWYSIVKTEMPYRHNVVCWKLTSENHYDISGGNSLTEPWTDLYVKQRLPEGQSRTTDVYYIKSAPDPDLSYEMVQLSTVNFTTHEIDGFGFVYELDTPRETYDPAKAVYSDVLTPADGSYQREFPLFENTGGSTPLWRRVLKSGATDVTDFMADFTLDSNGFMAVDMTRYPFPTGSVIKKIVMGDDFSAWLLTDGTLWVCGANMRGQLGLGDDGEPDMLQIFPVQVDVDEVYDISAAGQSLAVLLQDGRLGVCGANTFGQLGTGDKVDQHSLVEIDNDVETMEMYRANLLYRKGGKIFYTGLTIEDGD